MKTLIVSTRFILAGVIASFLFSSCSGGGTASNTHLLKLPGIAESYKGKIEKLEEEIEKSTDMEKAMKLDEKRELLEDEAQQAIDNYLKENTISEVPFEQKATYRFTVNKIWVDQSSISRLNFKATITINEAIVNNYGTPQKNLFAFAVAINQEGKALTRKPATFANAKRGPFEVGSTIEIYGSIDGPADLIDFEKLLFVTQDESTSFPKTGEQ